MNQKVVLLTLGVFAWLTLLPGLCEPGEGPDKNKVSALMQRKLQQSQKVLEGVALGDFDKIARHGEELLDISKASEWRVVPTPRYQTYTAEFQRTAENLIKHAKDKNLDAAALAYVELTLSCVKCHKHVREVRMVRRDD
jgi:hypothetical protein